MQFTVIFKVVHFIIVLLASGITLCYAEAKSPSGPKQVVETFQAQMLEIMQQGPELGFQGRYEKFEPAVKASHDLPRVARITIGRSWNNLTKDQQQQWVDVFTELSIASYAYNFKEFSGESFRYVSEQETPNNRGVIVHTYFDIPSEKKEVKFDYLMKKKGDSWEIINIIADGVSDLALKRSEYASVLKRDGFDVLVAKITEKINNYSQK